jgi:hypothetical protein
LKEIGLGGNSYYAVPGTLEAFSLTCAHFIASKMRKLPSKTIKDEMLKQA